MPQRLPVVLPAAQIASTSSSTASMCSTSTTRLEGMSPTGVESSRTRHLGSDAGHAMQPAEHLLASSPLHPNDLAWILASEPVSRLPSREATGSPYPCSMWVNYQSHPNSGSAS